MNGADPQIFNAGAASVSCFCSGGHRAEPELRALIPAQIPWNHFEAEEVVREVQV